MESGFFDKVGAKLPEEMIPVVIDEEKNWAEHFKEGQFDLIINNMTLHWVNEIEDTLRGFHRTLEPDGVFMSSSLGGETL